MLWVTECVVRRQISPLMSRDLLGALTIQAKVSDLMYSLCTDCPNVFKGLYFGRHGCGYTKRFAHITITLTMPVTFLMRVCPCVLIPVRNDHNGLVIMPYN
jgi:hypothetical protein